MCGRFTLTDPNQDLAVQFTLPNLPDMKPRYNIAPTQPVAAVRIGAGGDREMPLLVWGLIPSWARDPTIGSRLINARSETVAEKQAFRAAFKRRRCLVVADGFYEWQKVDGGKQPYYIHMRDGRPFAFAGLWERWDGPDGSVIESCTLLTTEPNDLVARLHNRMPVIVPPQDYDLWLDPQVQAADLLQPVLRAFPAAEMEAYAVSKVVNNPRNDGPACVEPLSCQAGH